MIFHSRHCLSAIWYSIDALSLIILIKRLREFLCIVTSADRIPNSASTTAFGVLSGRASVCFRDFLWNFSSNSKSFSLKRRTSSP